MSMQRYRRDSYENLDEYEDEEDEEQEEEEAEVEEDPMPTREEIEYLQLRQRLKESIRKQKRKETGSDRNNSRQTNNNLPYDNFGSFFGPSKSVISQRVIQESKSLLENQHMTARNPKASSSNQKSTASKPSVAKAGVRMNPPKGMNELRVKAQRHKDTRDYSFLLSDDAELPAPSKEPPARHVHTPHSEARSSQVVQKSKQTSSIHGRQILNGRDERKSASMNGNSNMQRKSGHQQMVSRNKSDMTLANSRKPMGSNSANGPGRPLVAKGLPSKVPSNSMGKKIYAPAAKQHAPPTKNSLPGVNKLVPLKNMPLSKHPMQSKREYQEPSRGKPISKQPVASSKSQMNRPVKQISSHYSLQDHRPKKKPARRYSDDEGDDGEGGAAISMIRQMFRYNPKKYGSGDYSDESDMEANFDDIMKEERRSGIIARKEDEEELRKIEEEERRVQAARKRKLNQR